MQDELVDLLTLNMTRGVGAVVFRSLRDRFGSARAILEANTKELQQVDGVSERVAKAIVANRGRGEQELALAEKHGVTIIACGAVGYPKNLLAIYDPPLVLYMRGSIEESDMLALAVVGARRCSHYGMTQAERFATQLAFLGFTIVSGFAEGIDTAAHRGAINAGGRTIAVLGNGLAHIYPKRNEALADEVVQHGALISEFPMQTRVDARHFPQRNRVISGLALGVIVVEAARRSGTLITAKWALEQGREVFAIPGRVDNPTAQGTHALIREGAKLVTCPGDVLEELGPLAETVKTPPGKPVSEPRALNLNNREEQVYQVLGNEPLHIDEIIRRCELPASVVSSTLTILEIKKMVKQLAGKTYVKA